MKNVLFVLILMGSLSSQAAMYFECGNGLRVTDDGYKLDEVVFAASSGNNDFSGVVGKSWNFRPGESSSWLETNKNITAHKEGGDGKDWLITIKVILGNTPSGKVGYEYKIIDPWAETFKAEKWNMGGFTGGVKVETYECFSANN